MPKQLCLSAIIDLPDDIFDAAELTARIRLPWSQLCSELKQAGVKHQTQCEPLETRAKPAATGAKRGRKSKQNADGQAQQPANPAALV